jgi:hypothetical protein
MSYNKKGGLMDLIECLECGKEISSNATACPGCGSPINKGAKAEINRTNKKYKKPITLFLAMVLLLLGIALFVITPIYLVKSFEKGGPGFFFYRVGFIAALLFFLGITLAATGYGIAKKVIRKGCTGSDP